MTAGQIVKTLAGAMVIGLGFIALQLLTQWASGKLIPASLGGQ